MTKSCKLAGWAILFALSVISCKKSSSEAEPEPEKKPVPVAHGTLEGTPVSKSIGPAGGMLQTPDGNITLDIPAGAVTTATNFSIQPVTKTLPSATGKAYRLTPENVQFNKDVKITLKYTKEDLAGTSTNDLYLAFQDAQGYWHRALETDIDTVARKLYVQTRHFSDWAIERIFYIDIPVDNTILSTNETCEMFVYMSDTKGDGKDTVVHSLVPVKNIDGWYVNGPGKFSAPKSNSGKYIAPASIPDFIDVAVGVRIKNLVSQRNPDRPGDGGIVLVQVPVRLVPDEYFTWKVDGTENVALATDAALLGTNTNIMGTGLQGGISLFVNGAKTGTYDLGSAVEPDKFNAQVSISGGTTGVVYLGTYYNCGEGTPRYGKGRLRILIYGQVGGIILGDFTATVYTRASECQNKSKTVTGSFKVRRKA